MRLRSSGPPARGSCPSTRTSPAVGRTRSSRLCGAVGLLAFAGDPTTVLLGMRAFGLALASAVPAKRVLAPQWSSSGQRRQIFAYKLPGESLGMAAGAFLAGLLVILER